MAENFNSDEFRKQREEIEKIVEIQKELNSGNVGLFEVLKDIHKYDRLIADQVKKRNSLKAVEESITKRIHALESKKLKVGSVEEELNMGKIIKLEEEKSLTTNSIKLQNKKIDQHRVSNRLIKEQVKDTKTLSTLIATSVNAGLKKGLDIAKKGVAVYVEQDAAIRDAAKSMGILNKQSDAFANNIYKASRNTNQLGIQAKDLAKIQGTYSNEIGRSVILGQEGLNAMAEMAAGTSLGAEGAAMMAANMENFGLSASMSRDILQETVDLAGVMGVNADKAIANLSKNLKLAQGYNFKKGVKGISEMSVKAAKFKISMESVAGVADKLIDVEGAVNMASQLQVLGGEWSKMADPFKLMYQARNDMQGLTDSITNAVKSTAQFNKTTGEFDVSAVEMHRLRKVAEQLGMDYKELAVAGKEAAKFSKINGEISMNVDAPTKAFIESTAQYNKGKGGYEILIGDDLNPKLVSALTADDSERLKDSAMAKESLAQRAKDSQTIDKLWNNLMNTFKSVLLPFMRAVDSSIRKPLEAFMADDKFEEIAENLADFGKKLGKGIAKAVELVAEFPKTSIALVAAIGGVKWFMHGVTMGLGFKSVTGAGGSGSGRSGSRSKANMKRAPKGGITSGGKHYKGGQMYNAGQSKGGKFGAKAGGALALGGMAANIGRGFLDDPDSDLGKGLGVLGSTAQWAGTGAMVGSLFGPVGTAVGGIAGGLGGLAYGLHSEYGGPERKSGQSGVKQDDFVMRPGEGAVPFSSSDTLVGAKPGGPIDKLLDAGGGGGASSGGVTVTFDKPLVIKGEITLNGSGSGQNIMLDDPILMREIASMVQQELRKSMGGGKLNPNPL